MTFFKALVPGIVLTLIVCLFIGAGGSSGGFLNIHTIPIQGYDVHWSWPMFIAATGLSWGVLWLLD